MLGFRPQKRMTAGQKLLVLRHPGINIFFAGPQAFETFLFFAVVFCLRPNAVQTFPRFIDKSTYLYIIIIC